MKILIVTTRVQYPPFKGDKLKVYNIVRHLAREHSVRVLCLSQNKSEEKGLAGIRALGAEIESVRHTLPRSLLGAFTGLFSGRPIQVSLYRSKRLGRRLAETVESDPPDVIYFHFIRSAQYAEYVNRKDVVRVLDFTDAVSLYLTRFVAATRNPIAKLAIRNERNRVAKYEPVAERFDTAFICSEIDRDYLKEKGIRANFRILPNGVDTEAFVQSDDVPDEDRIIFTGNMPYFPNEDAAVYFTKVVFPRIVDSIPNARLYIVGRKPTRKIRGLASGNVFVTGFVEDIADEYRKSAVAVAPTRFGAGTLNKVIEPIVLGVPVVATSIAARGLPESAQPYVDVADDADEFARKVIAIMKEGNKRRRRSSDVLDDVRRILSWENIVREFEEYLKTRVRK